MLLFAGQAIAVVGCAATVEVDDTTEALLEPTAPVLADIVEEATVVEELALALTAAMKLLPEGVKEPTSLFSQQVPAPEPLSPPT